MKSLEYNIKSIFRIIESSEFRPGVSIGVLADSRGFFFSEGKASLSSLEDISKDTNFHLASLTKFFTGLLFQEVQAEGLISRDMPISTFFDIPELNNYNITFSHLLEHRSGLRDQWDLTRFGGWSSHDPISNKDILSLVKLQTYLNFPPGTQYCYNNTGYTLLGLALEKATGKSIRTLLKEYLFKDGLFNSIDYYSFRDSIRHFAVGYKQKEQGQYQIDIPQFEVIGSTSMYASVKDLVNFERYFLSRSSQSDTSEEKKNGIFYRDGLIHIVHNDKWLELHSGWDYGYSSFLLRLRHMNITIIILSNMGKPNLAQEAFEIASVFDKELKKINLFTHLLGKSSVQNALVSSDGYFMNIESSTILKISREEKKVFLNDDILTPISKSECLIGKSFNTIVFKNDQSFELHSMGFKMTYNKIPNTEILNIAEYCGEYYSEELNVYYKILYLRERLIIQLPKQKKKLMTFINSEFFLVEDFVVKFSIIDGRVDSLYLSTMRSWNIRFQKKKHSI